MFTAVPLTVSGKSIVNALTIDLPETVSGTAVNMVSLRKGEMVSMEAKGDRMICEFLIPSRGIIGLRNQLLTATASCCCKELIT